MPTRNEQRDTMVSELVKITGKPARTFTRMSWDRLNATHKRFTDAVSKLTPAPASKPVKQPKAKRSTTVTTPDPATVAPNGPAAQLANAAKPTTTTTPTTPAVETVDAGGGILVDVVSSPSPAQSPASDAPLTPTAASAPETTVPAKPVKPVTQPKPRASKSAKPVTTTTTTTSADEDPEMMTRHLYHLERSERYEVIPVAFAITRNSELKRKGAQQRWVRVDRSQVPAGVTVVEPEIPPTGERRQRMLDGAAKKESLRAASAAMDKQQAHAEHMEDVRIKRINTLKACRPEGKTWNGHYVTTVIRWMAKNKWTKDQIVSAVGKLGFNPALNTITTQMRHGIKGTLATPEFAAGLVKELNGLK